METIKMLLKDAIQYDEIKLAYSIYVAVEEGMIHPSDSTDNIPFDRFPYKKIQEVISKDSLNLFKNMIRLYLVRRENDFAIYLAKNKIDVARLHENIFSEKANIIIDISNKIDTFFYYEEMNKYLSFRDIKKKTFEFPRFISLIDMKK